jgi:polar amino acid transport system ATP-binding protein
MILKVESINKSFNEKPVIKDISFEIDKGEIISLIGPSGAGKTTILRCINGLERCDGGSIEICGMKLCKDESNQCIYPSPQKLRNIRSNIGMVFQGYNLFPHLSVIENIIEAPIHAFGILKTEAINKAIELLDMLGLSEKADSYPFELSGGEKQRVAIARACALNPKLMCFDEPTSALDPELTEEIAGIIEKLAADNMAILIITHDMAFAKRISERIIFIEDGKIIKEGTKKEFFEDIENKRISKFLTPQN